MTTNASSPVQPPRQHTPALSDSSIVYSHQGGNRVPGRSRSEKRLKAENDSIEDQRRRLENASEADSTYPIPRGQRRVGNVHVNGQDHLS